MSNNLKTTVGNLTVDLGSSSDYPNMTIKLDGVPIVLIENNDNKIIIKHYPNSKVEHNNEYFNYKMFDIADEEFETIVLEDE